MKKCVITGSAGFIGSNLLDACLKEGWSVTGIDNFATSAREMVSRPSLEKYKDQYKFVELDINNAKELEKVFCGADVVFHLAALPRVSYSIDFPISAHHANLTGTLNVLEAARWADVRRVIFSCSSSIFGGVAEFPTPESAKTHPKSPYALHKQAGAEYCRLYSELYGMETCSLIYFNVTGVGQRANSAYSTVVPAFFYAAVSGQKCRIDGDGLQSRDLCDIANVVQANLLAANFDGVLLGDKFNIANGETHTVLEVFEEVKKLANPKLEMFYAPVRLGDPRKSHADISKSCSVLGYKPVVGFYDGLKNTAQWWLNGCPLY